MKKIFSALIVFILIFSFVSCGTAYEPVKSTDEEKRIVMTAEFDGEKYNIKYELYRAIFLSLKSEIDGGDESVWTGADKDEYIKRADALAKSRIADIYSVFHLAEKIGIDVYSREFDKYIEDFIEVSVEGGFYNDTEIDGFGGDYNKYLEYLKENNLNYSVQDLIIRYSLAGAKIFEYYVGNLDTGEFLPNVSTGKLEYTKDDVKAFYESSECVRVIEAKYFSLNGITRANAEEKRNKIIEKTEYGEESVKYYMIGSAAPEDAGVEIITRHSRDMALYSTLVETAFSLKTFDVSEVIEIPSNYGTAYAILYKTVKDHINFEEDYEKIKLAFLENEVGKLIDNAAAELKEAFKNTAVLDEMNYSEIKMN